MRTVVHGTLSMSFKQSVKVETDLLAETNPRPSIERTENVRVWGEVFVQPLVEEAIRIKHQGYR